jgi:hypothetical protein
VDVPVVEPRELRNVVVLPTVVAVPVVEPRESRNVTVLPLRVAVPMAEPRLSRIVVCWADADDARVTRTAAEIRSFFIRRFFLEQDH